jgi:hypothetical protein
MGALLRDIKYTSESSLTTHAFLSSIEEATKQCIWNLHRDGEFPNCSNAATKASNIIISGKKTLFYYDDTESP